MAEHKLVALTFDDGPTLGITDKVLDVLEENDVVASFFLIGQNITEQTEYLVKRAYNMGCTIENHSKTHPSMIDLTKQEILDEVNYTTERIEQVIGEKPQFFRPPYINYNQTMYDLIDLYFISVYTSDDPGRDHLIERIESRNGVHTIEAAADLGFGTREYELITVS